MENKSWLMSIEEYYQEFDARNFYFLNSENSFHISEVSITPVILSRLVFMDGLIKSRGAIRGKDYIVEYIKTFSETPFGVVAIHCVGNFINPVEDRIGKGFYQSAANPFGNYMIIGRT